jgi:hypothetical protein
VKVYLHEIPYFFNQKHAKFFKKAYPDLFDCITGFRKWDQTCALQEARLKTYQAMDATYHLLEPYLNKPGDQYDDSLVLSIPATRW